MTLMAKKYLYLLVLCLALVAAFRRVNSGSCESQTTAHLPKPDSHVYDNNQRSEPSDIAYRNAMIVNETETAKAAHHSMLRRHFENNLKNNGHLAQSLKSQYDEVSRANNALLVKKKVEAGLG